MSEKTLIKLDKDLAAHAFCSFTFGERRNLVIKWKIQEKYERDFPHPHKYFDFLYEYVKEKPPGTRAFYDDILSLRETNRAKKVADPRSLIECAHENVSEKHRRAFIVQEALRLLRVSGSHFVNFDNDPLKKQEVINPVKACADWIEEALKINDGNEEDDGYDLILGPLRNIK